MNHRLDELGGTTRRHLVTLINAVASCSGAEHDIDREILLAIDRVRWLTAQQARMEDRV